MIRSTHDVTLGAIVGILRGVAPRDSGYAGDINQITVKRDFFTGQVITSVPQFLYAIDTGSTDLEIDREPGYVAVSVGVIVSGQTITNIAVADQHRGEVFVVQNGMCYVMEQDTHRGFTQFPPRRTIVSGRLLIEIEPDDEGQVLGLAGHPDFLDDFDILCSSTSLAIIWVAVGRRAAFVANGELSTRQLVALRFCVVAGCPVTDIDGEDFGQGKNGILVAINDGIHQEVVRMRRESTK